MEQTVEPNTSQPEILAPKVQPKVQPEVPTPEPKPSHGKKILLILLIVLIIVAGAVAVILRLTKNELPAAPDSAAVTAGKNLSAGSCQGEGVPNKLSSSPVKDADFRYVEPYGLMVGGHVTPIDHEYFDMRDPSEKKSIYEIRAMGDSRISGIGTRVNPTTNSTEYRIVFSVSCTFLYYYDLVTDLEPDVKQFYDAHAGKFDATTFMPVKAGQLIGHIDGRTMDFAVWDTTKPLQGFLAPEHYVESWKFYTADPMDYYTDDLKAFMLTKSLRTAAPISGKIDYDIKGKLVGNWFQVGSNGYIGRPDGTPGWTGHLAIAPEHFDPTGYIMSIGYLNDKNGAQYSLSKTAPDPATIGVEAGLTKYDLFSPAWQTASGGSWDQLSYVSGGLTLVNSGSSVGCALTQLQDNGQLKFETIMGKSCSGVVGFTDQAILYER
jgi:hypothetical protein